MNIIALGAPGVGKGTYTTMMAEAFHLPHISTGDMFRENIKSGTPVGKKAREYMDKGQLVPDEIVIEMLKGTIRQEDCKKGFILDGFPRTIPQADALKGIAKIDVVLNFVAPDQVILDRLSGRRVCRKCGAIFHIRNIPPKKEGICDICKGELYQRDDDKEEVIRKRLVEYETKTAPLINYYQASLREVDVSTPISESAAVIDGIRKILKL
jgi:adenylate kinase